MSFSRLPLSGITRLHRYYPAIRLPVCHLSFFFRCQTYRMTLHLPSGTYRFSPVDAVSLCDMADLATPRCCVAVLPKRHTHIAFHMWQCVGTPNLDSNISGLICLMTLSPTFPCFTRSVTTCVLRIATGGWSNLTGRDFHPLNTAPLAGRTSSRLAPYEASPSTEPGVRLSRTGLLAKLMHQILEAPGILT